MPRGLEIYKDRLIAYSLGNFATGRGISSSGRAGLAPLLLVEMTAKGRLVGGRIVSFKQDIPGQPRLDSSGEAASLMHSVSLIDFETPGVDSAGAVMITEAAAKTMAAAYPRPSRAPACSTAVVAVKSDPALEIRTVAPPVRETPKRRGKSGRTPTATAKYEWDVYSGSLY